MILALVAALAAASCELDAPADTPLAVTDVRAPDVLVHLELWTEDSEASWAHALLDVLDDRHLPATLVMPDAPIGALWEPVMARLEAHGHSTAVQLQVPTVDRASDASPSMWNRLKKPAKVIGRSAGTRSRVAAGTAPNRPTEALFGAAGYRVLLPGTPEPGAAGRFAARFQGQIGNTVVLPTGPYDGRCNRSPVVAPFSAIAADRATTAVRTASGSALPPIVRVGLRGSAAGPDDAAVLARWLDEVLVQSGARLVSPDELHDQITTAELDRMGSPSPASQGGRLLSREDLLAVANALETLGTVPRSLPGGVKPTEAWMGFLLVLAGQIEGDHVRLPAAGGPSSAARSSLTGPTEIDRQALVALATQLVAMLPDKIPAALPVDGKLLTAGELLVAMASAVAKPDQPPIARPIAHPEPNMDGLGWGESTVP